MNENKLTCCFCGAEITDGIGNNPWPVRRLPEVCCAGCNTAIVIPARVFCQNTPREYFERLISNRLNNLKLASDYEMDNAECY